MAKVEWIANDMYFDDHGRLHILTPQVVQRVKGLKTISTGIEVNQQSVIIDLTPIPGPRNPLCPDGMCICRRDKVSLIDPERRLATKTKAVTRSRKPTSGI